MSLWVMCDDAASSLLWTCPLGLGSQSDGICMCRSEPSLFNVVHEPTWLLGGQPKRWICSDYINNYIVRDSQGQIILDPIGNMLHFKLLSWFNHSSIFKLLNPSTFWMIEPVGLMLFRASFWKQRRERRMSIVPIVQLNIISKIMHILWCTHHNRCTELPPKKLKWNTLASLSMSRSPQFARRFEAKDLFSLLDTDGNGVLDRWIPQLNKMKTKEFLTSPSESVDEHCPRSLEIEPC